MKIELSTKGHQAMPADGTMSALVYDRYGTPDVLRIEKVPIPTPKAQEVLVAIRAASINSWDWDLLRGQPFITRLEGWRTPRYRTLGADIAGRVVAVGASVTRFRPGDEVFGDLSGCGWGGFAEFVCASEAALTPKPAGIGFEQAAAVPQAGVLALQGLRDAGGLKPGGRVLFNGAGGGVGTLGIQYAKLHGAEVTGVDKAGKLESLRALGADHVIDCEKENFTANGRQYDLILDVVGNRPIRAIKRALRPGGTYVMVGGPMPRILHAALAGPLTSRLEKRNVKVLVHKPNHPDQSVWASLMEDGRVTPVIDRQFALRDAAEALRYFGEGRAIGKVIVSMAS
ncbi:NAD(P)-dependent alcohol dehydrogenase [Paenibacillus xanthanilyticus]|uniref:NAD(P)-dependent alcohol dehydrogenase n=1 Tax=Paenibacillus xanthanilyticus TaxID=1783531 RepID=A0ABV8K1D7_9BACL